MELSSRSANWSISPVYSALAAQGGCEMVWFRMVSAFRKTGHTDAFLPVLVLFSPAAGALPGFSARLDRTNLRQEPGVDVCGRGRVASLLLYVQATG